MELVTGNQAGLSGDEQIKIALKTIVENSDIAEMKLIYSAVNEQLKKDNKELSEQGKANLRFYVNKVAVKAGFIYPHDKENPGWRITPEGKEFIKIDLNEKEKVYNVDNEKEEKLESNVAKASSFELYILDLMKNIYPNYIWYHQGRHKVNERGLDIIGERLGDYLNEEKSIGVQVKLHSLKHAPTQIEWLKFLSGCFARRIEKAVFVTTGKLTSEQRREAGEAKIIIIEGQDEINRLSDKFKIEKFEFIDENFE